jgi:Copper transport outer membrane protein, MctB
LIDFRYHLVSIVAVFLALAVGIVLGSTEFQPNALSLLQSTSNSVKSQLSAASAQRDAYAAKANGADAFLQSSQSLLLGQGHLLEGQKVVLITEPGAPGAIIDGVKKAAAAAGATVTGQIALRSEFNDLSGATQSTLSSVNGSIANAEGTTLAPGADPQTTYQQQAAQLIGTAILAKPGAATAQGQSGGGQAPLSQASAQTLLKAYAQAGFLTISGTPTDRASLAVIVAPGAVPAAGAGDPANEVLVAIAQQFAAASAATVAAGSTGTSGQPGSAISVLRSSSASSQVSTVDNADTTQGQITVMQAIAVLLAGGKPSSYGISGAAAVSPDPVPTPTAVTTSPATQPTTGNGGTPVNKK